MAAKSSRRRRSRKRGKTDSPVRAAPPAANLAPAPPPPQFFGSTVGERPRGLFGGLPVSEFAILVGGISLVVGVINHGGPALLFGAIVAALGVIEVTGREHFSGYRSHTALLAAFPAVGSEVLFVVIFGDPTNRALVLVAVVPVFAISFWLLRRAFLAARQKRLARPPNPTATA